MEEKIFTINLKDVYGKMKTKRAPYAARFIRNYLKTHTKKENIKLGNHLNSTLWSKGIKKPPHKIRVRALIDGDTVKAEMLGYEYVEFRAQEITKNEKFLDKLRARMGEKAIKKEEEVKLAEGKEEKKGETKVEEPNIEKKA